MSYLDDATQTTSGWEGKVPWLYRDTRGNATVGVGEMLPNLAAALALPFQITGAPATPQQIGADWARVMSLPFGQKYAAGFFRSPSSVVLSDADILMLLRAQLTQCDAELRGDYPGYDGFPDAVKIVLLDCDYNLGNTKLRNQYPRFDAAVDAQNWALAATECNRGGISAARNEWAAQTLQSA